MRWTSEMDNFLRECYKKYTVKECAEKLQTTKGSILNRARRLGFKNTSIELKSKIISCLNCGKEIKSAISQNKKFCNHYCSATYNNSKRSLETKVKQRNTLLKTLALKSKINQICKTKYYYKQRFCKLCKLNYCEKHKTICNSCKENYYKHYRVECNFTFSIKEFEFLFTKEEMSLLEINKMYSASNRGNNKNGVSRDHLLSVKHGFLQKIKPFIISHPANCSIIKQNLNAKKGVESKITIEELYNRIIKAEEKKQYLSEEQINYIKDQLVE